MMMEICYWLSLIWLFLRLQTKDRLSTFVIGTHLK